MSLEFYDDTHTFILDGERLPSVTELLAPLQEESFKAINPYVLKAAADRGTAVHEITEEMDYDMDYEELLTPELVPYADAYDDFLMDYEPDWYGIEAPVHYFGMYAGIVDRFGYINGEPVVLDIKTVQSPTIEQKVSVSCQLYAYGRAIKACYPDFQGVAFKYYALYLKKDGSYKLFDCDEFCREEDIAPNTIWQNLFSARQLIDLAKWQAGKVKENHRRKK